MPKSFLTLVSLLAVLTRASVFAQTAVEHNLQQAPAVDQSHAAPPYAEKVNSQQSSPVDQLPQLPPTKDPSAATGETLATDAPISLDDAAKEPTVASLSDFLGYRYSAGSFDWIPGGGNQFGMFSIEWDHYQKSGVANGVGVGMGFHFLSGPDQTDMPPRVYDFSLAYQVRERLGPFGFDVAAAVLAASDFKGSARQGILFPSHAVGFLTVRPAVDIVLGVDFLDRQDIKLLPVAGLVWVPNPDMRFELVFPRPRVVYQLTDHNRIYLSGELGGGTWEIERVALFSDLATYHDLRACIGLEYLEKNGERSAFEIGYLFDRRLEYSSGIGNMHLNDAVMFRLVTTF